MATSTLLFRVPISTGGSFECISPAAKVYLLSFESQPDNRITIHFITAFLISLDKIEGDYPNGVVITTSKISKFYSNGLDLIHVGDTPGFRQKWLFPLFRRLITYPMPTIALLNGHTFAAGMMLAMYHDYRVQNPSKGFLCINELLFGVSLDATLMSVFREKVTAPGTFRALVLEAKRFGGQESFDAGLVDAMGGLEETLALIKARSLTSIGNTGVYGAMKQEMYPLTAKLLEEYRDEDASKL